MTLTSLCMGFCSERAAAAGLGPSGLTCVPHYLCLLKTETCGVVLHSSPHKLQNVTIHIHWVVCPWGKELSVEQWQDRASCASLCQKYLYRTMTRQSKLCVPTSKISLQNNDSPYVKKSLRNNDKTEQVVCPYVTYWKLDRYPIPPPPPPTYAFKSSIAFLFKLLPGVI